MHYRHLGQCLPTARRGVTPLMPIVYRKHSAFLIVITKIRPDLSPAAARIKCNAGQNFQWNNIRGPDAVGA